MDLEEQNNNTKNLIDPNEVAEEIDVILKVPKKELFMI